MYTHSEMQYNFYFLLLFFVENCRIEKKRVYDTYSYNKVSRCSWDWIEYAMNMEICL